MADSKVQIEVTADTSDAKAKLADLEAQADRAMDSGANSAKKFAKGLDEVGKSAELSARQIKGVVAGMASMAAGVASAALKAQGREKEASYLGGAASGAAQGAGMLAPLGGAAMAAGALAGAGIGAAKTYFEREAQGKQEAASMRDLADALEKARETMDATERRANAFSGTLERLGDVSRSTNDREAEREKEIARRREEIAAATDRMTKAEEALRQQAAAIDGPQTEEQKKAADNIREVWAKANQDLSTAKSEIDRLKDAKVEAAKPAPQKPLDQRGDGPQLSAIEKLGAKFGAAQGDDKSDEIVGAVDSLAPAFADGADDVAHAVDAAAKEVSRTMSQSLGGLVVPPPEVRVDAPEIPPPPPPPAPKPDAGTYDGSQKVADAARTMADQVAIAVAPFGPAATSLGAMGGAFADAVEALQRAQFGSATEALDREANRLAEQQLDVLRTIAEKTGGPASFA